jgi:hypothetical protein
MQTRNHQGVVFALALVVVAAVAFASYSGMLRYGFTASDTYSLIATGRIASFGDVGRVFREPLMGETAFAARCLLYRPVSSLSFGLDHAVWGLNPFGYHLTDLVLHVLVTLLVFLVVHRLTAGRTGPALLAALLFTIHPVLVETVPAVSRRQDVLATLFVLLALLLQIEGVRRGSGRWTAAAVVVYVLALGSKEIAAVFPVIVAIYGAFALAERPPAWRRGVRLAVPHAVATVLVFAWRIALLHRLGGVAPAHLALRDRLASSIHTIREFVGDLIYPVSLAPASWERAIIAAAPWLLLGAAVAAVGVLLASHRRLREVVATNRIACCEVFFLLWLPLLLLLFVVTVSFSHRCMYLAVVPFSAFLALFLADGWRELQRRLAARPQPPGRRYGIGHAVRLIAYPVAGVVAVYLIAFSPLLRTYSGWRESAELTDCFFSELAAVLPALPDDAVLHVAGLPIGLARGKAEGPLVQSVTFPADYSIKSWLDLQRPGNHTQVVLENRRPVSPAARRLHLDTRIGAGADVYVQVRIEPPEERRD